MAESILSNCTSGGCGAKIGPGELRGLLQAMPTTANENLLVGYDASDDAAVYRYDEKGDCLVSTVDFFSPMVEDARTFGRIAASNALSDVYAMGGTPLFALNLVCFPQKMDKALLAEMLAGGAEKVAEAGAVVAGGHSIYDHEPKYGLAVTGRVNQRALLHNNTPAVGHSLVLTKPLGVGIILAASRVGLAAPETAAAAVASMERLNRYAAEKLAGYAVSACTDVTGFGLLAHALEMAGEKATVRLATEALPLLPGAKDYANEYLLTAAGQRNRTHVSAQGIAVDRLPFATQELLFDPQTSGGLLLCVAAGEAEALLRDIRRDDPAAAIIGEICPRQSAAVEFV